MLPPQQQSLLTELIQNTVVRVCVDHVPFEGRLELDGLVCINSDIGGARQIVVKIHTVVGRKDVFAERMVAQRTAWQATPLVVNKNGLSQNTADAVPHDARSLAHEDASSAASEALEDGDCRSGETVDDRLPPWSRHAPQILKLLTKSDAASDKAMHPSSSELGPTSSAGVEKTSDTVLKKEPTMKEDASPMEVEAAGDHHSAKWRCKMCQLLCANFTELESHMRIVHVRFVCRLCLNSFTLSCNLRRHMKLHAGVRPHSCPFCSASFSRSTDLKIHMKKHPTAATDNCDRDSPKSVQDQPLSLKKPAILHECDLCDKGFAAAAHLAEHRCTHNVNVDSHPVTAADRNNTDTEQISSKADSSCHNYAINGSASVKQESFSGIASAPIDFAETVREFAPLFHLGDAGIDAMESDKASAFLATITQQTPLTKAGAPVRSKRKGLPIKHIDVGTDDYEMATDDGESMMKDASMVEDSNVAAVADASPDSDVSPTALSQLSEEQVDIVSGDLESKVFNCQYAGGCSVTCHGFTAYERHYTAAHGGRYPCALCPQSFTSRNNRRRHTDGHAGAAGHGRHQCVTCGKRFARADIIKEHRLTHTRSYQLGTCSKCGESCGTKKSSLLLHLKRCLTVTDIDGDICDVKVTEPEPVD